jgi:hypothetical protein
MHSVNRFQLNVQWLSLRSGYLSGGRGQRLGGRGPKPILSRAIHFSLGTLNSCCTSMSISSKVEASANLQLPGAV